MPFAETGTVALPAVLPREAESTICRNNQLKYAYPRLTTAFTRLPLITSL